MARPRVRTLPGIPVGGDSGARATASAMAQRTRSCGVRGERLPSSFGSCSGVHHAEVDGTGYSNPMRRTRSVRSRAPSVRASVGVA